MSIESSNDPQSFADFEHHAWETVSRGYEEHFARLTNQSVNAVLDAAEVTSGKQILDVCCGPGMITAVAIARGAEAKGIDFSAVAVEIATSNVPDAEIHEGDAQSLPFNDDTFDAVICGFGIIHVPDPKKALSEMRRVLKHGGRVAVSTWEAPNPNNGFGLLFGSIKANADMDIDLPHGPDFFQFSDPEKMTSALQDTGFNEPSASTVVQIWEFNDSHGFITGIIEGTARARALITAQTDAVQAAITDAVVAGMDGYSSSDGIYRVPMPALIGSAVKQLTECSTYKRMQPDLGKLALALAADAKRYEQRHNLKKRLSENEEKFYERVDEILIYKWDPIGISEENWPRDEYQSYTPQVFKIALQSSSPEPLAEYLNNTVTERMGLSSVKKHDLKIAKMIIELKDGVS